MCFAERKKKTYTRARSRAARAFSSPPRPFLPKGLLRSSPSFAAASSSSRRRCSSSALRCSFFVLKPGGVRFGAAIKAAGNDEDDEDDDGRLSGTGDGRGDVWFISDDLVVVVVVVGSA